MKNIIITILLLSTLAFSFTAYRQSKVIDQINDDIGGATFVGAELDENGTLQLYFTEGKVEANLPRIIIYNVNESDILVTGINNRR